MNSSPNSEERPRPATVLVGLLVVTTVVVWLGALLGGMPRPIVVVVGIGLLCADLLTVVMVRYSTQR